MKSVCSLSSKVQVASRKHTHTHNMYIHELAGRNVLLYFVRALIRAFMCTIEYTAIGQLIRITTIGSRPPVLITSGHDDQTDTL